MANKKISSVCNGSPETLEKVKVRILELRAKEVPFREIPAILKDEFDYEMYDDYDISRVNIKSVINH